MGKMQTLSGRVFDYAKPHKSMIHISDIANALSMTCRYAGQVRRFYSVAEHSVLCYKAMTQETDNQMLHFAQQGVSRKTIGQQEGMIHDQNIGITGTAARVLYETLVPFVTLTRQAKIGSVEQGTQFRCQEGVARKFIPHAVGGRGQP